MSSQSVVAQFSSPLKDLVLGTAPNFGKTEKDKAEVTGWLEKVGQGGIASADAIKDLDVQLVPRTYIVSNYLTAADVAIYGALHPVISQLQPAQYYVHPALTRYFDHIQSAASVRSSAEKLSPAFAVVQFDIENAPKPERKVEIPRKKEKAPKASAEKPAIAPEKKASPTPEPAASSKAPTAAEEKPQKKDKKEKKQDAAAPEEGMKKKAAAGGKAVAAEEPSEPVPSMIDLRVGHIIDVMKHPDADGLYVEQIDIGEETGPRTVVSGLVHYIPIEEMRDKWLVAVCNLKPANMRGVKSFAMVLAATSKDGKEGGLELIQPPPNSKPGDRVYFEGPEFENAAPLPQLNPKKKIFETIQPGFTTLDTKVAAWVHPVTKEAYRIRTKNGYCVAPTLIGASLS